MLFIIFGGFVGRRLFGLLQVRQFVDDGFANRLQGVRQ